MMACRRGIASPKPKSTSETKQTLITTLDIVSEIYRVWDQMAEAPKNSGDIRPSLGQIADVFVRYGNFTLGGGSATTAVMHGQIVTKHRWLNDEKFSLCFALGRVTPGTNLLAFGTGVGWMVRGFSGAIVALLAGSIPCASMVIVLTALFRQWQENSIAQAAIHGAVAAAVAITAKTSWTVAGPIYRSGARLRVVAIGAVAFILYVGFNVSAIYILVLAGVLGALLPASQP